MTSQTHLDPTKKFKRKITNWIFDNNPDVDDQMVDANLPPVLTPSPPNLPHTKH